MSAASIEGLAEMFGVTNRRDHRGEASDQILVPSLASGLRFLFLLGQRYDAKRRRTPSKDRRAKRIGAHIRGPHPGEFRGAAANIDDERNLGLGLDQAGAAERGKLGLFFRRNDIETEAEILLDSIEECLSVRRRAAGLGSDTPYCDRSARFDTLRARREGLIRTRHRSFAEAPGMRQALTKADDARVPINDAQTTLAIGRRNKHAAIVRTQIERSEQRRFGARTRSSPAARLGGAPIAIHA
jgi:hypothetical protein